MRIVSLVPSLTELLHALGAGDRVVGITKFCLHPPEWFRSKTRIGGTKDVDLERVKNLRPDLIIANREENVREQIQALARDFEVLLTDISTWEQALQAIEQIGQRIGAERAAEHLTEQLQKRRRLWEEKRGGLQIPRLRAAYFIWRNPYMVAASGTFIDEMLRIAGFVNVFAHRSRYPEVSAEDLQAARPEALLLSSEPYPFRDKHLEELRALCPQARPVLVDGELFSWYGSRLLGSFEYFERLWSRLPG